MLVHIGYGKAGSSWLQHHLRKPESGFFVVPRWIYFEGTRGKREFYEEFVSLNSLDFDPGPFRRVIQAQLQTPEAENKIPVVTRERWTGHWLSGGYDTKEIADKIHATFPEARIVIQVREQRKMLSSVYRQYVRKGGGRSLNEFFDPPPHGQGRGPGFQMDHFKYDRIIRYYQKLFGRDKVLALPLESISANPLVALQTVQAFGGAKGAPGIAIEPEPKFPGISAIEAGVKRRMNAFLRRDFVNDYSILCNAFTKPFAKFAYSCIRRSIPTSTKIRSNKKLEQDIQSLVGDFYTESNRQAAELTGIDFRKLGYM
jgi:hypothetical protein